VNFVDITSRNDNAAKNSTFHSFENLQNILNAAKSLGVGIKADVSAEDFFSKTRRREALFFLSDLIDAAYQRSKEKGDSQLPPPPLTAANEKIETVMSRGNAALDQTSTYPALQNVLKQSNVDSKVSSILKSFSDILCQKVLNYQEQFIMLHNPLEYTLGLRWFLSSRWECSHICGSHGGISYHSVMTCSSQFSEGLDNHPN